MNISLKFKKALKKIIQEIDPNIHHAELPSSIVIPMRYIPDYLEKNEELLANAFNRLKDKKSQKTFLCVVAATITNNHRFYYHALSNYKQYYNPLVKPEKNDIIIDAGGFDGIGAIDFINYLKGKGRIITLEPSPSNFKILEKNIALARYSQNIISINKASWNKKDTLFFSHDITHPGARITNNQTPHKIHAIDIDSLIKELKEDKVSIIKMDVEGSELKSLYGCLDTIKKYKPKLQISVYHRPEDLWEISNFIENLNLGYKQYLGHHYYGLWESVLYAKV